MDNNIDFLIGQSYQTKTGLVYLSECESVSYEIDFALTRLLDLHLRSTKQVPIIDTESHFNSQIARGLFSVSVSAMNSSLLTFDDEQIEHFLNELLDICYKAKSTAGFESVFFTALNSYSGDNIYFKEFYYQKFISFGEITEFGGGFNNSYFIDKKHEAFIGFDIKINDLIKESKITKDALKNLSNRMLNEKGILIDSTTGLAISSATLLSNAAGAALVVGATAILGYYGYKSWEAKEKIKSDYNKAWKEVNDNDPENKTDDKGKNSDDSDDDFPETPEKQDNPEGCIRNPLEEDYITDPYSNFSKGIHKSILPIGKGFRAYNFKTENNIYTFSKMPKLELSKAGLANISKLGLLNDFPNFKIELEKRQIDYLKTLSPINKTDLVNDFTKIPTLEEIKESDPGFGVNTQTYTHTTTDEYGNETVTTEQVNTIVLTDPALIERYGNSISVSTDKLESMIKFFKMLAKSNNTGVIDVPKNAGDYKLNKFINNKNKTHL